MCQCLFFDKVGLRPVTLLKKKTLAQVFSCEFLEIFKNTFLDETPLVAASVSSLKSKSPLFSNIELSQLVYSSIERFLYDYISICRLLESILIMWIINLK